MLGKCLFLPVKWFKSHVKYDFMTHGHAAPIYLPIKYGNFAQSPFKLAEKIMKIKLLLFFITIFGWLVLIGLVI